MVEERQVFYIKYWYFVLKIITILTFICLLFAILLHPFVFAKIMGKQGEFSQPTKDFMYMCESVLLAISILLFFIQKSWHQSCSDKTKEYVVLLLLFLSSLVVMFFVLEGAIRIFAPQETLTALISASPKIFEKGEYISWQFKPNATDMEKTAGFNVSYSINAYGMRDGNHNLSRENNTIRILLLGDSFTEGFAVEQNETFAQVLESILTKNNSVEIWNAGIRGYSVDTEYIFLKNNIEILKPDMVLIGFYVGNDVLDLMKTEWTEVENNVPQKINSKIYYVNANNQLQLLPSHTNPYIATPMTYLNIFFGRWSQAYVFLKQRVLNIFFANAEGTEMILYDIPKNIQKNWETTKRLLIELRNVSYEYHATFHVIIIPMREQINEQDWSFIEKKLKHYKIQRDLPQQILLTWCLQQNITCIDLYPGFLVSNLSLYNTLSDSHFNKNGHELAAKIIAENLQLSASS